MAADEKIAPAELKKYLRKQVKILGTIVDVFKGEGNDTIDTGGYRDASAGFLVACGEQLDSAEEPSDDSAEYNPKVADFTVTIKVKKKQCFGSAGCNITFEANLGYEGSVDELPAEGTTEVTYEVSGAEDPYIGTLEVDGEGTVTGGSPETIQTTSSSKKLKAKVTEVEYNEFG